MPPCNFRQKKLRTDVKSVILGTLERHLNDDPVELAAQALYVSQDHLHDIEYRSEDAIKASLGRIINKGSTFIKRARRQLRQVPDLISEEVEYDHYRVKCDGARDAIEDFDKAVKASK